MNDIRLPRQVLSLAHFSYYGLLALVGPIRLGARLLLVQDNSVLLVYHSYLDNWHLPGGGLKRGETMLESARREAYEEAGAIVLDDLRLVGVYLGTGGGRSDHTAIFACESFALIEPTDRWEIIGRAFFSLDALPADLSRGYRQVIAQYRLHAPPVLGRW
jgi:8-oxo-dGTP pyrophosphatase MutT (NUDIX family)